MEEEPPRHIIAIIGAGIAGPVLALQILSHPILRKLYRPIIYERLPSPASLSHQDQNLNDSDSDSHIKATHASGAAVALTSNALFPLYSLGLREQLNAISCETERIRIWRAYGGSEGSHKYFNKITHPNWQEDLGTCLRVVERGDLQKLVLDKFQQLGGEIIWGKKLNSLSREELQYGEQKKVGLVVGADGGWSGVRKWICEANGKDDETWKPYFSGADGIYGVSKPIEKTVKEDGEEVKTGDTHWVFLDSGIASTWALPEGRQFWTISFPSKSPPERGSGTEESQKQGQSKLYGAEVVLGGYSLEETEAVLKRCENAWHPVAGNFGELFRRSERIVRAPLWYRAWEQDEIAAKNMVLIGDASRLMLPSSGQGACFAIEDATVLANALLNNPPSPENDTADFSAAIKEYTEARVPRSKSMTNQSYYTALLGMSDRWWWRWLRDFATAWVPMGGDPKTKASGKKPKDPMGWLYEPRFQVEPRVDNDPTGKTSSITNAPNFYGVK